MTRRKIHRGRRDNPENSAKQAHVKKQEESPDKGWVYVTKAAPIEEILYFNHRQKDLASDQESLRV